MMRRRCPTIKPRRGRSASGRARDRLAWGLSAVAATFAGILWGTVQGVDWCLSLLLMKALAIAILGGLDSIRGVLVAAVIVGVLRKPRHRRARSA